MIEIIPAIDIIDGKCVRLTKGDYSLKKVYDCPVDEMALRYADCGVRRIHMVDLDGAREGCPRNLKALEKTASKVGCEIEWGGGISSAEALDSIFSAGATQGIIGSVAALKPELFREWLATFGGGRIILGADIKDGLIAVKGWLEKSVLSIDDMLAGFMDCGLEQVIVTDISRDGTLQGPSFELYSRLQSSYPKLCFTVSGGISCAEDIEKLNVMGLKKVIAGKAIYENKISLEQIEKWSQNA